MIDFSRWSELVRCLSILLRPFALAAMALCSLGAAALEPADLPRLWESAQQLRLGDTAYRAAGTALDNGVCSAQFDDGVLIPVLSGSRPDFERVVGVVFVGHGEMSLGFPERADAWRFANHRVAALGESRAEIAPIAAKAAPWRARFDRALVLSADARVQDLLVDLDPIGSGMAYQRGPDGIDEVYVVTEKSNALIPRIITTNILADRTRLLADIGMDPSASLAFDRVAALLGTAEEDLRTFSEFRTESGFSIAQGQGGRLGAEAYDRWLSCLTDAGDQFQTGFGSMAFSTGMDGEGRHHFERWSGQPIDPHRLGATVEPLTADTTIQVEPVLGQIQQRVQVRSRLSFRAVGGPIQHVVLRLPVLDALARTWSVDAIRGMDGKKLTTVGLFTPSMRHAKVNASSRVNAEEQPTPHAERRGGRPKDSLNRTTSPGTTDPGTTSSGEPLSPQDVMKPHVKQSAAPGRSIDDVNPFYPPQVVSTDIDRRLISDTISRKDILVVLPAPVAPGEMFAFDLSWATNWMFANFTAARNGDDPVSGVGVALSRQLGATTGPQPFLPEVASGVGPTRWQATTRVGVEARPLSPVTAAVSGQTVREWVDKEGWAWVEARAQRAVSPIVAIGRWRFQSEPASHGMPGVRVHHFAPYTRLANGLPAEVRRVVHYLNRFLPDYDGREIEVYQNASLLDKDALAQTDRRVAAPSLIGLQTVRVSTIRRGAQARRAAPHRLQASIARQVAHQWWGQKIIPATARDRWAIGALAEVYADFYLRSAHGEQTYRRSMDAARVAVEGREIDMGAAVRRMRSHAMTGATFATDIPSRLRADYARVLLAEMIRPRIGDHAFFGALDALVNQASKGRLRTADLQAAFEQASGQDLTAFFDWWVHGGVLPKLRLETRIETVGSQQVLHGCIVSDLPFGRFDVPVEVIDRDGERTVAALVDVVDGRGRFEVSAREGVVSAALDPMGRTLAWRRDVRSVRTTRCDEELAMATVGS
jgi:hypothetical protein